MNEVQKYVEIIQSNSSDCTYYNIWILNLFDSQLQVINTKSMIKKSLKNC